MRRAALAFALAFALAAVALDGRAGAEPRPSHWLRQHSSLEWVIGVAAFRSGLSVDARAPGFDAFAGGGELSAGLDVYSGLGVVLNGRILAGGQAGNHYLEWLADAGLQLRVSETVRIRGGPTAGQCKLADDGATLVGGFIAGSIDLFALGTGRLSTTLGVRLDVDAMLGGVRLLPDRSLSFALGLGVRY